MPARGYEFYLRVVNSISHSFKGAIYYVTITTVISSRVKITCYLHVSRYEVFAGTLAWYFPGVYIINLIIRINKTFFHEWSY